MLGQGKNVWQAEIDAAAEVRSVSVLLHVCSQRISAHGFAHHGKLHEKGEQERY